MVVLFLWIVRHLYWLKATNIRIYLVCLELINLLWWYILMFGALLMSLINRVFLLLFYLWMIVQVWVGFTFRNISLMFLMCLSSFIIWLWLNFKLIYQILRSDNGREYVNLDMKQLFAIHGLIHQTTCPNTPQQNGVAERKNCTLLNITRSLMFESHVPAHFGLKLLLQPPTSQTVSQRNLWTSKPP